VDGLADFGFQPTVKLDGEPASGLVAEHDDDVAASDSQHRL
jgi:hypothetical protein